MTKFFFDVFPSLKLDDGIKKLLSVAEVTKVAMNHGKDQLRVYITSTRLIHKKEIYRTEQAICDQIFKGRRMQVTLIEKYRLSDQYTPESLMELYRDSILEELRTYSLMEYNLLRTAQMEFPAKSRLRLTLENTIIAQTKSDEIVEFQRIGGVLKGSECGLFVFLCKTYSIGTDFIRCIPSHPQDLEKHI